MHGFLQTFGNGDAGPPAQRVANAGGINRVARVMARAVGDKCDLVFVRQTIAARAFYIENVTERLHQLQIGTFILTADIIAAPQHALLQHQEQRVGMVLNIERQSRTFEPSP